MEKRKFEAVLTLLVPQVILLITEDVYKRQRL